MKIRVEAIEDPKIEQFMSALNGSVILGGEVFITDPDTDFVFVAIADEGKGFNPGAVIGITSRSEDEAVQIADELLHETLLKRNEEYDNESVNVRVWALPVSVVAEIIDQDKRASQYVDLSSYVSFEDGNYVKRSGVRVQADSYPNGYDIELPDYADNDGVDIITFFDMMQNYHSGQWDPVYAFTSRRRGDDLSLEELRAAKNVLEEIISGKFGEEALKVENENEGYSDMEIAESWLPTLTRLVAENEHRDEEEENTAEDVDSDVSGSEVIE